MSNQILTDATAKRMVDALEAIQQKRISVEKTENKTSAITDTNKASVTLYPNNKAVADYVEKLAPYRFEVDISKFTPVEDPSIPLNTRVSTAPADPSLYNAVVNAYNEGREISCDFGGLLGRLTFVLGSGDSAFYIFPCVIPLAIGYDEYVEYTFIITSSVFFTYDTIDFHAPFSKVFDVTLTEDVGIVQIDALKTLTEAIIVVNADRNVQLDHADTFITNGGTLLYSKNMNGGSKSARLYYYKKLGNAFRLFGGLGDTLNGHFANAASNFIIREMSDFNNPQIRAKWDGSSIFPAGCRFVVYGY